jgi:hypothetical protein
MTRADLQLAREVPVLRLFRETAVVAIRSTTGGSVPPLDSNWQLEDWWLAR